MHCDKFGDVGDGRVEGSSSRVVQTMWIQQDQSLHGSASTPACMPTFPSQPTGAGSLPPWPDTPVLSREV